MATETQSSHSEHDDSVGQGVVNRLNRRILWLPFLLGFVSIIDRVNIGFASKSLSSDLGLSSTVYGFAAGILFLGYFALEIPSNLALRRFGSRIWMCRIAITWGLICCLTAFAPNAVVFCIARFLLGAAEAGLFPGVVLYLTLWYPSAYRARAIGIFMACVPVATILGGPLAGWIMGLHGTSGLHDWQWLFLIEGIPAVLLGLVLLVGMVDTPDQARFLTDDQRQWLLGRLADEERSEESGLISGHVLEVVKNPLVWIFALIYFCYACGQYGLAFFLPGIIKSFGASTPLQVGLWNAIPYGIGTVAMILVARHSDRTGERRWHLVIPMTIGAFAMLVAGLTLSNAALSFSAFIVVGTCMMTTLGNFWARPTRLLSTGAAAAVAIAAINSLGNIGGFVGPYLFGWLVDLTGGKNLAGLVFLAIVLLIGAMTALVLRPGRRDDLPR